MRKLFAKIALLLCLLASGGALVFAGSGREAQKIFASCFLELQEMLAGPNRTTALKFLQLRARITTNRLAWGLIQHREPGIVNADFLESRIRQALSDYARAGKDKNIYALIMSWEGQPYRGKLPTGDLAEILQEQHQEIERKTLRLTQFKSMAKTPQITASVQRAELELRFVEDNPYRLRDSDLKLIEILAGTKNILDVLGSQTTFSQTDDKERVLRHIADEQKYVAYEIGRILDRDLPDCKEYFSAQPCGKGPTHDSFGTLDALIQQMLWPKRGSDLKAMRANYAAVFEHSLERFNPDYKNIFDVKASSITRGDKVYTMGASAADFIGKVIADKRTVTEETRTALPDLSEAVKKTGGDLLEQRRALGKQNTRLDTPQLNIYRNRIALATQEAAVQKEKAAGFSVKADAEAAKAKKIYAALETIASASASAKITAQREYDSIAAKLRKTKDKIQQAQLYLALTPVSVNLEFKKADADDKAHKKNAAQLQLQAAEEAAAKALQDKITASQSVEKIATAQATAANIKGISDIQVQAETAELEADNVFRAAGGASLAYYNAKIAADTVGKIAGMGDLGAGMAGVTNIPNQSAANDLQKKLDKTLQSRQDYRSDIDGLLAEIAELQGLARDFAGTEALSLAGEESLHLAEQMDKTLSLIQSSKATQEEKDNALQALADLTELTKTSEANNRTAQEDLQKIIEAVHKAQKSLRDLNQKYSIGGQIKAIAGTEQEKRLEAERHEAFQKLEAEINRTLSSASTVLKGASSAQAALQRQSSQTGKPSDKTLAENSLTRLVQAGAGSEPLQQAWAYALRRSFPYFSHNGELYSTATGEIVRDPKALVSANFKSMTNLQGFSKDCWRALAEVKFNKRNAFSCKSSLGGNALYSVDQKGGQPQPLSAASVIGVKQFPATADDYLRAVAVLNMEPAYLDSRGATRYTNTDAPTDVQSSGFEASPNPLRTRSCHIRQLPDNDDPTAFVKSYIESQPRSAQAGMYGALQSSAVWDRDHGTDYVARWAQAIKECRNYYVMPLVDAKSGKKTMLLRSVNSGLNVNPYVAAKDFLGKDYDKNILPKTSESCLNAYVAALVNEEKSYLCYESVLNALRLYRMGQATPVLDVRGDFKAEWQKLKAESPGAAVEALTEPAGKFDESAEVPRLQALINRQAIYKDMKGLDFEVVTNRRVRSAFPQQTPSRLVDNSLDLLLLKTYIGLLKGIQKTEAQNSLNEILGRNPDEQVDDLSAWAAVLRRNRFEPSETKQKYFLVTKKKKSGDVALRDAITGKILDPFAVLNQEKLPLTAVKSLFLSSSCRNALAGTLLNSRKYFSCYEKDLGAPDTKKRMLLYEWDGKDSHKLEGASLSRLGERLDKNSKNYSIVKAVLDRSEKDANLSEEETLRLVALLNVSGGRRTSEVYSDLDGNLFNARTQNPIDSHVQDAKRSAGVIVDPKLVIQSYISSRGNKALQAELQKTLYLLESMSPEDRGDFYNSWALALRLKEKYFSVRSRASATGTQTRYYQTQTAKAVEDPQVFVEQYLRSLNQQQGTVELALANIKAKKIDANAWAMSIRSGEQAFLVHGRGKGDPDTVFDTKTGQLIANSLLSRCPAELAAKKNAYTSFACESQQGKWTYYKIGLLGRSEAVDDIHTIINAQLKRQNLAALSKGELNQQSVLRAVALSRDQYFYEYGGHYYEAATNQMIKGNPATDSGRHRMHLQSRELASAEKVNALADAKLKSLLNSLDDLPKIISYEKNYPSPSCNQSTKNVKTEQYAYSVVDKANNRFYVFNKDGELLRTMPVLLGMKHCDERTKYSSYKVHEKDKSNPIYTNRCTGAGAYQIGELRNGAGYYRSTYGRNGLFSLNDAITGDEAAVMALHRFPKGAGARQASLQDGDDSNNRMSNGCINLDVPDFADFRSLVGTGCRVYVLPENLDPRVHLKFQFEGDQLRLQTDIHAPDAILQKLFDKDSTALAARSDGAKKMIVERLMAIASKDPATNQPWVKGGEFELELLRALRQQVPALDKALRPATINPKTGKEWAKTERKAAYGAMYKLLKRYEKNKTLDNLVPEDWKPLWKIVSTEWPKVEDFQTSPRPDSQEISISYPAPGFTASDMAMSRFDDLRKTKSPYACIGELRARNMPDMDKYIILPKKDAVPQCLPGEVFYRSSEYIRDHFPFIKDRKTTAAEFMNTLNDHKAEMMPAYGLSNEEYNLLVPIAYGILKQESDFGQSPKYLIKLLLEYRGGEAGTRYFKKLKADEEESKVKGYSMADLLPMLLTGLDGGGTNGLNSVTPLDSQIDAYRRAHEGDADKPLISFGLTQMKNVPDRYLILRYPTLYARYKAEIKAGTLSCPTDEEEKIDNCAAFKIRENFEPRRLQDPRESAYATMAFLAEGLRNLRTAAQKNSTNDLGAELNSENLMNYLQYVYGGGMKKVSGENPKETATPATNTYLQNILSYSRGVEIYQTARPVEAPTRNFYTDGAREKTKILIKP